MLLDHEPQNEVKKYKVGDIEYMTKVHDQYGFLYLVPVKAGKTPNALKGHYTSYPEVDKAIAKYREEVKPKQVKKEIKDA